MRTIETTVFKFNELSDTAKQKAIDRMRETDFYQSSEYFSTVKKALDEMFGLELTSWDIDWDNINRSDWKINFDRMEDYRLELTGQRLRTYLVNNLWCIFFERKHWGKYAKNESTGKWRYPYYSKIQRVKSCCPFTGFMGDECFLDVFRDFLDKPNEDYTLQELIETGVHNVFRAACDEWEAIQSDDYTIESIEANEYEFTEDGEMI
jgi:hypothetical protein